MTETGLPCVHCGLCLDTCPTYRLSGSEAESPRGRIYLMEAVTAGTLPLDTATSAHLDSCLGCLACESACPSGVEFHRRIDAFRGRLALPAWRTAWRRVVHGVSQSRRSLLAARVTARIADACGLEKLRRRVPGLALMPARRTRLELSAALQRATPRRPPGTRATRSARVALLTGCAADVLRPEVTRAARLALRRNGALIVDVPAQGCCGALSLHSGNRLASERHARSNTLAFLAADVDFIVTTAAGCGAQLRQYGTVLAAHGDIREEAQVVADRARDVSEVLCELGLEAPAIPLRFVGPVAYHDACHLLHVSKVSDAPRRLLQAALGRPPIDLGENGICCGSAGSYNLENPGLARRLGDRKAELAHVAGAAAIAVANVGCMLQIELGLSRRRLSLPVMHPVEFLAEAYAREPTA